MKKILLVEDEAVIALAEAKALTKHGFAVVTARNGEKAVTMVEKDSDISLVLTDIDLGKGMNGTDAARQLLEKREMPVVFLTGHAEKEMVDTVKGISRYGYVLKNSGEFVLVEAINMAFELFEARKKMEERERQYGTLVNNSPFGIAVVDENLNFVAANPLLANILGQSVDSIIGKTLSSFFNQDEVGFWGDRTRQVLDDGQVRSFQVRRGDRFFYNTLIPYSMGDTRTVMVIVQDVTERAREQEALKRHVTELSAIYDHTPVSMFLMDENLRVRKANAYTEAYTGLSTEELKGSRIGEAFRCLDNSDDPRGCGFGPRCRDCTVRMTVLDTFRNKKSFRKIEAIIPRRDTWKADTLTFLLSTDYLTLDDEPFVIVSIEDITDRKETERRLAESLSKYRGLFNSIRDSILVADTNREIIDCNAAFADLFGYDLAELKGKKTSVIYDSEEEFRRMGEAIRAHTGKSSDFLFVVRYKKKDGSVFPGETNVFYLQNEQRTITGFIGLIRDITGRRQMEETQKATMNGLVKALKENENLLREMNHRVKNNLSLVSSLIRLKESTDGDGTDFSDLARRIDVIAAIHEKLCGAKDVAYIDVKTYIHDILRSLFSSCTAADVEMEIDVDEVAVPAGTAMTLGLITNEIAMNAVKYGFAKGEKARFAATLHGSPAGANRYVYTLSNSGNAFPEDIDLKSANTLGLRLITTLAEQLNGTIGLKKKPYPVFTLVFPVPEK